MNINKLKLQNRIAFELNEIIYGYNIESKLRIAHFLSQTHHESAGFKSVTENLNYSAERLLAVFPKYFKTIEEAKKYARKPELIANKVYANRMGNGDEASGDGWKYRGRSYIQLTGKNNYIKFGESINKDIINNPDIVAEQYALIAAGWFWKINNINEIADKGTSIEVIKEITKKINGGYNGIEHRQSLFNYYYKELNKCE
jgi:putative chitinase